MDISNPIKLMPHYYKQNDTYKDKDGCGILERFLKSLGQHLSVEVVPEIDSLIDKVTEISTIDQSLLNQLWELLGSVPYSFGTVISSSNALYGEPGHTEEPGDSNPRARFRDLITYMLSLYKIRGTLDFYPALLRIYGYDAIVRDPSGDLVEPNSTIVKGVQAPYFDSDLYHDSDLTFDLAMITPQCINVTINIIVPDPLLNTLALRNRLYDILNRFRPVGIKVFGDDNVTVSRGEITSHTGFTYMFPFTLGNSGSSSNSEFPYILPITL